MNRHTIVRARLETLLAILTAFLFVLSLVTRDWIEVIFRVDPDRHSGSLEWTLVAACGVVAVDNRPPGAPRLEATRRGCRDS